MLSAEEIPENKLCVLNSNQYMSHVMYCFRSGKSPGFSTKWIENRETSGKFVQPGIFFTSKCQKGISA